MNFGQVLEALKKGKKISRSGWDDIGLWLGLEIPNLFSTMTHPYIYIEYPNGSRYPWTPSSAELFAKDWYIKGEENA